jgi:sporulation protein YlmC with PRC-barrel domain
MLQNLVSLINKIALDYLRVVDSMKFRYELLYKEVYCENLKVGIVTDVIIDAEEWKITHLEIKLTKEASKEILGAKKSFINILAISAVAPASKNTSKDRVELQVSKGQLHMYLRPP